MSSQIADTGCCPRFDPTPWDQKAAEWNGKRFIRDRVFTCFFVPVNFGRVIKRMMAVIEHAGAKAIDNLALSDHTSRWNMDLYVAVDREIPGAANVTLSGRFLSKVYEGPFKETRHWCEDFERYTKEQELNVKKWFMWYTTCPKCAKAYGKNYVVILGQVG